MSVQKIAEPAIIGGDLKGANHLTIQAIKDAVLLERDIFLERVRPH
jgi:hypothetical protein